MNQVKVCRIFLYYRIQKMVESGLILRWENRWRQSLKKDTTCKTAGRATILGLERMGGVLIVYAGFAATALIALLSERAYNKLTRK